VSSILAHFLCALRFTVVLACLIVEIVTTCAACMGHLCESHIFGCVPNGQTLTHGHVHCPCLTDMRQVCSAIHMFIRVVYLFCARLEYWTPSHHALDLCLSKHRHPFTSFPLALLKQTPHSSRHRLFVQISESRRTVTRLPEECYSRKGTLLHYITTVTTTRSI